MANVHSNYVQPQALNFHCLGLMLQHVQSYTAWRVVIVSSYKYFIWSVEVSIKVTWIQRQYSVKSPCIKD